MSQVIKVEKRMPFGFRGEWATLYKLYTFDDVETVGQTSVIKYQNHNYLKIPTKLQLKTLTNTPRMRSVEQEVTNLADILTQAKVITTDAYFDVGKKMYKSVVDTGDIILFRGEWWQVKEIDIDVKYTPARQEQYICTIINIDEEVIVW